VERLARLERDREGDEHKQEAGHDRAGAGVLLESPLGDHDWAVLIRGPGTDCKVHVLEP
jgi:hypothetical protein